jgi:hypothetical protein
MSEDNPSLPNSSNRLDRKCIPCRSKYSLSVGSDCPKAVRVRRPICQVWKLKFRTRQETQDHIKNNFRRIKLVKVLQASKIIIRLILTSWY